DLTAPVRASVMLVAGDDAAMPLPSDLAGVVEVAGARGRHGSLRAIVSTAGRDAAARRRGLWRRPVVLVRELLWRSRRREEALERRAAAAVEGAIRGDAEGPAPRVVALDAFDALIASPFVAAGRLVAVPGAGRWLADAGDAEADDPGPGDRRPHEADARPHEAATGPWGSGPDDAQR
ncbi:MAG TPA: hypothetical protein VIR16_11605, partial [Candidatus Limnocylindrales bacterium]